MRLLSLCLCVLIVGCGAETAAPTSSTAPAAGVQQDAHPGLFNERSPFYLAPAGVERYDTSLTIPDRIAFKYGSAELDFNGRIIALLQGQRASQLQHYDAVLVCGWTAREENSLGLPAAQELATARCRNITDLYHLLDSRTQVTVQLAELSAASVADRQAHAETFATLALTPSGRSPQHARVDHRVKIASLYDRSGIYNPGVYFEGMDGIYLPVMIGFDRGSAVLSANARTLLAVIAQLSFPRDENTVVMDCLQEKGEGGTAPTDNSLARRRCEALHTFLVDQGLCEYRVFPGNFSLWIVQKRDPMDYDAKFSIGVSDLTISRKDCQSGAKVARSQ